MVVNPYGDTIAEHARHPRNYGSLDAPDLRHEDVNPFCGDRVRIELKVDGETVTEARFQGDLCVIAKAAASLLTGMITGLTLAAVRDLPEEKLLDALGAPIQPARRKCALLPLEVVKAAVD